MIHESFLIRFNSFKIIGFTHTHTHLYSTMPVHRGFVMFNFPKSGWLYCINLLINELN